VKMKRTPREGALYANTGAFLTWKIKCPPARRASRWGGGLGRRTGPAQPSPSLFSTWTPHAVSHLHAVRLITHGHRLSPHVAHGAGLRRLGHGREALGGLGGHVLWREVCDGRRAAGPCWRREPALPTYLIALGRSRLVGRVGGAGGGPGGALGRCLRPGGPCWVHIGAHHAGIYGGRGASSLPCRVTSGTKFTFHILTKGKENKDGREALVLNAIRRNEPNYRRGVTGQHGRGGGNELSHLLKLRA